MDTKSKGGRRERQARELLQEKGYRVEKAVRSQFNDNDFFNLFDLIAVKPDEKIKFIQVKSNGTGGELNNTMEEAGSLLPLEHCTVEFWIMYDYKGWRVLRMRDEWTEVLDERGSDSNIGEEVRHTYV